MNSSRDTILRSITAPLAASVFLISMFCGCGGPAEPEVFTVMTYNLDRYNLDDRDGDGQINEPKPDSERDAVIQVILNANPDTLAVQEIGNPEIFEEFQSALSAAGLSYPHVEYLQRGDSELNMAVLSRHLITVRRPHTADFYSIGEAKVPVLRGFIDVNVQVTPDYSFRLFTAHLKSKVFHRLGQTEMRRNEARLLNKHVRHALKQDPEANILVVGDMNDIVNSAPLRELTGDKQEHLYPLRPVDHVGDVWTCFDPELDQYSRIDYALVSPGMRPEVLTDQVAVLRDENTSTASDHRPVLVTFQARDAELSGD